MSLVKNEAAAGAFLDSLLTKVPQFLTFPLAIGGILSQSVRKKRFDKGEPFQEHYAGKRLKGETLLLG